MPVQACVHTTGMPTCVHTCEGMHSHTHMCSGLHPATVHPRTCAHMCICHVRPTYTHTCPHTPKYTCAFIRVCLHSRHAPPTLMDGHAYTIHTHTPAPLIRTHSYTCTFSCHTQCPSPRPAGVERDHLRKHRDLSSNPGSFPS